MTSAAILWVDETVDQYQDIKLPDNWTIIFHEEWGGIATAMNWVFEHYPNAAQYGWLADDCVPRTPRWDKLIERSAENWFLASGQDKYASRLVGRSRLRAGFDFGAPMCWGGELVRATGWWALPGVKQAGIDTAWAAIVSRLHLANYNTRVICEHWNYRTGKRPYDETDKWIRDGVNYIQEDIDVRNAWADGPEYLETIMRIEAAMIGP